MDGEREEARERGKDEQTRKGDEKTIEKVTVRPVVPLLSKDKWEQSLFKGKDPILK